MRSFSKGIVRYVSDFIEGNYLLRPLLPSEPMLKLHGDDYCIPSGVDVHTADTTKGTSGAAVVSDTFDSAILPGTVAAIHEAGVNIHKVLPTVGAGLSSWLCGC